MPPRTPSAFTLLELLAVIIVVMVLMSVVLPTLAYLQPQRRLAMNQRQLRGIHQGMITWTHMSRLGTVEVLAYPGIDWRDGTPVPNGPKTGYSGNGTVPGARLWTMLEGNFFTPEYIINPQDATAVEVQIDPVTSKYQPLTARNHSYAMLSLMGSPNETSEWIVRSLVPESSEVRSADKLDSGAVILGDRAIGTGPADISSVWTESASGDWRGHVVRKDNSIVFETNPVVSPTKYGQGHANINDDLFADDPTADDALLVHDDAVTAYSAQ